jgi:hypothetical protein
MEKVKAFFKGIWQFVSYLFVPQMGSRRKAEQQVFEDRLDEAMRRSQSEQ